MTTFRQLLEFFEQSAKTQAAKGKRFEDFCEAFLQIDPLWSERFDAVWAWQDWPDRPEGLPDTGVDLVARERGTGDIVAIQCKFYSPSACCVGASVDVRRDAVAGRVRVRDADLDSGRGVVESPQEPGRDLEGRHLVCGSRISRSPSSIGTSSAPTNPTQLTLADRKTLRPHQERRSPTCSPGSTPARTVAR